jgi:hypothetical protein
MALLIVGCAVQKTKPAPAPVAAPPAPAPAPVSAETMVDHSGDSVQTAISVPADAPDGGIEFENRWIFQQYGRFRRSGGGTGSLEGRRYNVVKIELPNGEQRSIYFDITENWDRWNPQQP